MPRTLLLFLLCTMSACATGPEVSVDSGMRNLPLATAQVPVSTGYPLSTQQKMQAMHHWDQLAERVAAQGSQAFEHFLPDAKVGVFVAPAGSTPFAKSYREALITHLVAYGVPIAFRPEGNVILEINTELINHSRKLIRTEQGAYRTLEPGFVQHKDEQGAFKKLPLVAGESGYFGNEQPTAEIQVNTSFIHQNSYLYRDSSIFYVDATEWRHYQQRAPQGGVQLKEYSVVDK